MAGNHHGNCRQQKNLRQRGHGVEPSCSLAHQDHGAQLPMAHASGHRQRHPDCSGGALALHQRVSRTRSQRQHHAGGSAAQGTLHAQGAGLQVVKNRLRQPQQRQCRNKLDLGFGPVERPLLLGPHCRTKPDSGQQHRRCTGSLDAEGHQQLSAQAQGEGS